MKKFDVKEYPIANLHNEGKKIPRNFSTKQLKKEIIKQAMKDIG